MTAVTDNPNLQQLLSMSDTRPTAFPFERGYSSAGALKTVLDSTNKANIIDEHR